MAPELPATAPGLFRTIVAPPHIFQLRLLYFLSVAVMLSAISCTGSQPESAIKIVRLDHAIESGAIADADTAAFDAWIYATTGISDTGNRDSICRALNSSAAYTVFAPDIAGMLPDDALTIPPHFRKPDGFPSRIYGVISPYRQSVVTVDTLLFVALNHYLGADYAGYRSFPAYQRLLKEASRIPLDVTEAWLRSRYPSAYSTATPTLLQRMVYEGALAAATADCLDIDDGPAVMGWTAEEWDDAIAHEAVAWERIVGGDMLYADDPALISRIIEPAPASPDVSPDAPGRIGRFIGLRMVRASSVSPLDILGSGGGNYAEIMRAYPRTLASSRSMTTAR